MFKHKGTVPQYYLLMNLSSTMNWFNELKQFKGTSI